MIGNDIVELKAWGDQFNNRTERRMRKIFTQHERGWLIQQEDIIRSSALLWSMKEAAYKSINRHSKDRIFNPLKLNCVVASGYSSVVYNGYNIPVKVLWNESYSSAYTYTGEGCIDHYIFETNASDKTLAAEQALNGFYKHISNGSDDVEIIKINRTPYVKINGTVKNISISHHKNFHYYCYEE